MADHQVILEAEEKHSLYQAEFQKVFRLKKEQQPFAFKRHLMGNVMGSHRDHGGGQSLLISLPLSCTLFFYPHSNDVIDIYNLEQREFYSYCYDATRPRMPQNMEHWSYVVWQVLGFWQNLDRPILGMHLMVVSDVPLSDSFSMRMAMRLEILRLLHVYVLKDKMWLHLNRRDEQLSLIDLLQRSLREDPFEEYSMFELYGMILARNMGQLIFSNSRTLEPRAMQLKLKQHQFWLVYMSNMHRVLKEMRQAGDAQSEVALLSLQALGLQINNFNAMSLSELKQYEHQIKREHFLSAKYLVEENIRVALMAQALDEGDEFEVVRLMKESADGMISYYFCNNSIISDIYKNIYNHKGVVAVRLSSLQEGLFMVLVNQAISFDLSRGFNVVKRDLLHDYDLPMLVNRLI
ncbi:hypothetical protein [Entomospira culicis]|uniref:Uncharacterized protein n=1 Tax=Entomospira culicis TaxID=2719989 RepID=A0A968GK54_9SPIO|nr:hypothetical protein [Entomospira culicis]NIZ19950.1 hypothetical protein [Entomospira culicis]NIZ70185.1 hypothetical protein [Entomospira culicis]WDI38018.1 hypothetical protein PVA46_08190 [Entomospira culicis]WDI39641.1 hypothetical protein PVA47_08190 [Entomospira culicis]